MRKISKYALIAGFMALSPQVFAAINLSQENVYYQLGAGVVFPGGNAGYVENSSTIVYGPTSIGTSYFILPNVAWSQQYHTGYDLNAAIGYKFRKSWRADAEFLYQNFKREISGTYGWRESYYPSNVLYAEDYDNTITNVKGTVNLSAVMLNGSYDFAKYARFIPQLGIGLGVAWIHANSTSAGGILDVDDPGTPLKETAPVIQNSPALSGAAFAYQLKLACGYELTKMMCLSLQYRFFATTPFIAKQGSIVSNPGTSGHSEFYTGPFKIKRMLTNSAEVIFRFRL